MGTCPKCGSEINEKDVFCRSCGASLKARMDKLPEKETYLREREMCFGEAEPRRDYSSLVSFGIFLLIVGITFIANPNLISDFRFWIEQLTTQKTLLRPLPGLITSAAVFFGLVGASDFFMAGVRFMADKPKRRVLRDVLTGVALVLFSYLIYLYGERALAWQMVLASEVVACGLLVIVYSVMCYLFPEKLQ